MRNAIIFENREPSLTKVMRLSISTFLVSKGSTINHLLNKTKSPRVPMIYLAQYKVNFDGSS